MTIDERKPQPGDIWRVTKTGGAQEEVLVIAAFEQYALTTRILTKKPKHGETVQVGEEYAGVEMITYTYYGRFDKCERKAPPEALMALKEGVCKAIMPELAIPNGVKLTQELQSEVSRKEIELRAVRANADGMIEALREENDKLKAAQQALGDPAKYAEAIGEAKKLQAQYNALVEEHEKVKAEEKNHFRQLAEILAQVAGLRAERDLLERLYHDLLGKATEGFKSDGAGQSDPAGD